MLNQDLPQRIAAVQSSRNRTTITPDTGVHLDDNASLAARIASVPQLPHVERHETAQTLDTHGLPRERTANVANAAILSLLDESDLA